jgi:hypothetical protein
MAAPTGAFVAKNATLTIATVAYANQVRVARLVPDAPIQTYRTLVPDGIVQDVDSPSWTLELTGLQINKAGGLAKALRAMEPGDTVSCVLAPQAGEGESAAFDVMAVPVPFGGEQGSFATMELVFPVIGEPVFTDLDA